MFIYCLTEDFKEKLLKENFKLIAEKQHGDSTIWIFAMDKNKKFNFSKNEEGKLFYFSNKLSF